MGIPAPRIDYDSLATPGGIGQGLAALGGSLANAAARRQQAAAMQAKAEQEQAAMAQRQQNEAADRASRNAYQQGMLRQGDERIANDKARIGLEGLQTFGKGAMNVAKGLGGLMPDPVEQARIRHYDAMTERAKRPSSATPARDPRVIPAAVWNQLDQEATAEAADAVSRRMRDPAHIKALQDSQDPWGPNFLRAAPGPAPMDDNAYREEVLRKARERRGLHIPQPWQAGPAAAEGQATAPIAAKNAPASAGTIRKRVAAAYGQQIPPDVQQALDAAEAGDEDALADLEEVLTPGAAIAPEEDPTTLLGP